MARAQISQIAYYLPEQRLGNEELAELFSGWTPESIEAKLGVRQRRIAAPDETATDMAVAAAEKLFERGAVSAKDIDFVILCTQSPDYILPTSACIIQDRLGIARSCGAFDFNLGCSGFVYGLAVARGLIETGLAQNLLLLTSDTYSKYISETDRVTRPLFGDGAAATWVRAVDGDASTEPLIGPFVLGTDGSRSGQLIVPAGGRRLPPSPETAIEQIDIKGGSRSQNHLYMDGHGVFSFSMETVPAVLEELLEKAELKRNDVDLFVFHQANRFMLENLRQECDLDERKFVIDMQDKGNTVGSTIPIALVDRQDHGCLKPGDRIVMIGFGVGLSWAGAVAILPDGV